MPCNIHLSKMELLEMHFSDELYALFEKYDELMPSTINKSQSVKYTVNQLRMLRENEEAMARMHRYNIERLH